MFEVKSMTFNVTVPQLVALFARWSIGPLPSCCSASRNSKKCPRIILQNEYGNGIGRLMNWRPGNTLLTSPVDKVYSITINHWNIFSEISDEHVLKTLPMGKSDMACRINFSPLISRSPFSLAKLGRCDSFPRWSPAVPTPPLGSPCADG